MDRIGHLIVGGDSKIGLSLASYLDHQGHGKDVAVTSRRSDQSGNPRVLHLDMEKAGDWNPPPCEVAYLVAASARLGPCRLDPIASARINVEAPEILARKIVAQGGRVLFLSSDKVFDGTAPCRKADEPVSPGSVYGGQKAEAERRLLALGDAVSVLRLSKVVEPDDNLFSGWISDLASCRRITPFSDLWFAPVSIGKVIAAMYGISTRNGSGIWQLSGREDVSYLEAARFLADRLGADPALISPETAEGRGIPLEERPRHTTLDSARVTQELGLTVADPWTELSVGLNLGSGKS